MNPSTSRLPAEGPAYKGHYLVSELEHTRSLRFTQLKAELVREMLVKMGCISVSQSLFKHWYDGTDSRRVCDYKRYPMGIVYIDSCQ